MTQRVPPPPQSRTLVGVEPPRSPLPARPLPRGEDDVVTPPRGLTALSGDALRSVTDNPATAIPMIAEDLKRIARQLEDDRKRLAHVERGVVTAIQQSAAAVTRVGDVGFSVTEEWGLLKNALAGLQQSVSATNANISALAASVEQLSSRLSAFEVRLTKAEQLASAAVATAEAAEDWAEKSGQHEAANVAELKRRASRGDEFIERLASRVADVQVERSKIVDVEQRRADVEVQAERSKTTTKTVAQIALAFLGTGGVVGIVILVLLRGCQSSVAPSPAPAPAPAVSFVPKEAEHGNGR